MGNIGQNNPTGKDRRPPIAAPEPINKQEEPPIVEYLPDRREMGRFIRLLFRKVGAKGNVKLSAFPEHKNGPDSGKHVWVHLEQDGIKGLIKEAIKLAYKAANDDPPRVFCPPPVVFCKGKGAMLLAVQTAPALFIDCDRHPGEAQRTLETLLGPAHIVVHSGGMWQSEKAGKIPEPKCHLYWVLSKPAESPEELAKLAVAQKLAIALIDGDPTMTLVHPLRWPGAWHRKGEARLCKITGFQNSAEIDLDAAHEILNKAFDEAPEDVKARFKKSRGNGKAKGNGKADDADPFANLEPTDDRTAEQRADEWGELFDFVLTGTDYHDALNRLAMKLQLTGMNDRVVRNILDGLMRRTPENERDARWKARHADIERTISTGRAKADAKMEAEKAEEAAEAADIQPVDLWGHFEPPKLPRGLLPKVIETFAFREGEMMGADPAGLAMGALVVCAAAISDEIKLQVKQHSQGWSESAILWVGLLGGPSERKSPIMREVERPLKAIDTRMMHDYLAEKAAYAALSKEDQAVREEPRRERLRIEDTTIEACQDAQRYNPRGMLASQDEISGWFGSMDKYGCGGKGAGKDRGFWLQTWNGGSYLVDRCARGVFIVPNIGLSMLGGMQDSVIRKLASEVYDDGLIQRLLPLVLRAAMESKDEPAPAAVSDYAELIEKLCALRGEAVDVDPFAAVAENFSLMFDEAAQKVRQQAERKHREWSQQLNGFNKRLASHIGKYDGYFARLCLVFHVVENVGAVRIAPMKIPGIAPKDEVKLPGVIQAATAEKVAKFMHAFLFPHAVAFYAGVLGLADDHDRLAGVAGYVLAHGLSEISNRDIARGVRDMKKLNRRETDAVFEQLESLGWLIRMPGKRPSSPPRWKVNPAVHSLFARKAKEETARRKQVRQLILENAEWVRGKTE